jgi:hypothetical protein
MNPIKSCSLLCAALGLALATPVVFAGDAAPAAAPEYNEEQKAALKALDAELNRFDAMLEKDDDIQHKATVKAFIDAFKDRRDAMNKAPFDQGKYDEIRFDINVEYQRLAMWLADPITPPPPKDKASDISLIPVYRLSPAPNNRADVKAALDAADTEIARLEKRASSATDKTRMQSVKAKRADLNKEFTKARWEALIAEMKGDAKR